MLNGRSALIWSAILGAAAIVGSYGLACVLPFAALAAVAALTLDARRGLALVVSVWAANQVVGFTLLSYPQDGQAVAWSALILGSAIAGYAAARAAMGPGVLRAIGALAASVAVYQVGMLIGATILDAFASSTPEIVASVVANDVLWFTGLMAAWTLLGRTSFLGAKAVAA